MKFINMKKKITSVFVVALVASCSGSINQQEQNQSSSKSLARDVRSLVNNQNGTLSLFAM